MEGMEAAMSPLISDLQHEVASLADTVLKAVVHGACCNGIGAAAGAQGAAGCLAVDDPEGELDGREARFPQGPGKGDDQSIAGQG
jgi:hypothetical protein